MPRIGRWSEAFPFDSLFGLRQEACRERKEREGVNEPKLDAAGVRALGYRHAEASRAVGTRRKPSAR